LPLSWYTEVADSVNAVNKFGGHDDLTIDSENHIKHSCTHDIENHLETLKFLEEEHVKRNVLAGIGKTSGSLESSELLFYFNFNEIWWQELDKFLLELILYLVFEGAARC